MQCACAVLYCHLLLAGLYYIFPTLSHKRHDFLRKLLNIKRMFWFSLQLWSEIFRILRRIQRDNKKTVVLFYVLFVLYRSMYCLCVNVYCHRVTTQLQLTYISIWNIKLEDDGSTILWTMGNHLPNDIVSHPRMLLNKQQCKTLNLTAEPLYKYCGRTERQEQSTKCNLLPWYSI